MNERIKKLRKSLGLTQREFADKLGMKQNSIAQIEIGRPTSDQTILSICREFGVREEWLREGAEPMKEPEPVDELEELGKRHNATSEMITLARIFLTLSPETQKELSQRFRELYETGTVSFPTPKAEETSPTAMRSPLPKGEGNKPSPLGKVAEAKPLTDEVIEAEVAEYRRELMIEKTLAEKSSASYGQGGK